MSHTDLAVTDNYVNSSGLSVFCRRHCSRQCENTFPREQYLAGLILGARYQHRTGTWAYHRTANFDAAFLRIPCEPRRKHFAAAPRRQMILSNSESVRILRPHEDLTEFEGQIASMKIRGVFTSIPEEVTPPRANQSRLLY